MASITTRAGKGSALTHTEVDNNFTNLNTDKVDKVGDQTMAGSLTAAEFIPSSPDVPTNGLYYPAINELGFSVNSANAATLTSTSFTGPAFVPTSSTVPTNGVYLPAANTVGVSTGSTQRLTISTTAATCTLPFAFAGGAANAPSIRFSADVDTGLFNPAADTLAITTGTVERARFSSTGLTSVVPIGGPTGAVGTPAFTFSVDLDTGVWRPAADTLAISTAATERLRFASNGLIFIGKTATSFSTAGVEFSPDGLVEAVRNGLAPLRINRLTSDGNLVEIFQDTVVEGTISVSGTTVSYNGAHLSRWSQLPSGQERIEILRGSVLSNIDEMCEWGDENNEQLNRMKVSDIEGDKNVSGVFQGWDDDDDTYTNDFYCAMTGDFIIRIAEGVTVERGDLLMSAGDGTAKPQEDDIVRSKTIAKVTSTVISCTYEDGSYCVPCVLMAC